MEDNRNSAAVEHRYDSDDRCVCGGEVVWFADRPVGNGCSVEGRPWAKAVAKRDPQNRRRKNKPSFPLYD
jgi:hypothetical protein